MPDPPDADAARPSPRDEPSRAAEQGRGVVPDLGAGSAHDVDHVQRRPALVFEGRPSAGPPRIQVRLAHPASSSTRAYTARFDLSIASLAIPLSAARELDLGTIRDDLGLLHAQVTLIFEHGRSFTIADCAALVVSNSPPAPEVALGRDLIRRGVFTLDGPADRWTWTLQG